jgi:endo-1,4-beta-xylanase
MENFEGNSTDWENMLKDHVQTIVTHCKRYVRSWDVVNEAFNDDGSLRNNIWLQHIGKSYIEKAFRYAYGADSTAVLLYNDYSIEKYGPKLNSVISLFSGLRKKGVKVDGIGMQMHVTLTYPEISEINDAAMQIQKAGFKVHYSELDVRVTEAGIFISKKKLQEQQRTRYRDIVKGYTALDKEKRFGITMWGVSDNDSWLMEDKIRSRPLLFNVNYKIKPAYCGFLEGLSK